MAAASGDGFASGLGAASAVTVDRAMRSRAESCILWVGIGIVDDGDRLGTGC